MLPRSLILSPISRCFFQKRIHLPSLPARRRESSLSGPGVPTGIFLAAFAWYSKRLDSQPLLTKGISSGIIAGLGDLICQIFIDKPEKEAAKLREEVVVEGYSSYWWWWDPWRTGRFVFLGFTLTAPLCHFWYGGLASQFPLLASGSNVLPLAKRVVLDQFVFTPLFVPLWISSLWSLESLETDDSSKRSTAIEKIPGQIAKVLPDILVANWALWIPVQFINFRFTPTKFQVLASNCVALVWNAYLSFSTRSQTSTELELKVQPHA